MSAPARIGGFAALLAVVFAAAALAGSKLDPKVETTSEHEETEMSEQATSTNDAHEGSSEESAGAHGGSTSAAAIPGLAVADSGLRLVPAETRLASGEGEEFSFRIVDDDGETVRRFEIEHRRPMHLIAVRRDFANFQHVHPRQLADGSWQVELDLEPAGAYRVFADFATDGKSLTLATDVFAAGEFRPQPLPEPANTAGAGGGYEVALESPAPKAGSTSPTEFTVSRNGRELESVEPYLGADGHLVALREHDQAFLHTHPEGEPGGSGPISFAVEYPTAGRYRLFLQFKHDGEVHTAAFTQEVGRDADAEPGDAEAAHDAEAGAADHDDADRGEREEAEVVAH